MLDADKEAQLERLLSKAKGQLFFKKGAGFLGPLMCNLDFRWNEEIPTARTNGFWIEWNPDFFLSLSEDSRVTVLAHEIWHVGFSHITRLNGRDAQVWNWAGDYVINWMLKISGYDMSGFPYMLDPRFANNSTDEVYDILMAEMPPPPPEGGLGFDIDFEGGEGGDGSENGPDDAPTGSAPGPTQGKINAIMQKIASAAASARMSKNAGDIPGEISMIIDQFLNPKLPWEQLLRNFFTAVTDTERSFRKPNRRFSDPILPGIAGTTGLEHLVYYLDISGSISDHDVLRFNSEVKSIKDEFNPERLTLVTFDTQIQDVYDFTQDDEFEKIEVTGRGGTSLHQVWEDAKLRSPTAMIVFTDLYVNVPPESPGVPLLWVCIDNDRAQVPYGKLIHLSEDD